MKFTKINKWIDELTGSHKVGELPSQYTVKQLTSIFGNPIRDNEKVTYEWVIRFTDGKIATIYDYKGFRWSIGGHKEVVGGRVQAIVANKLNIMEEYFVGEFKEEHFKDMAYAMAHCTDESREIVDFGIFDYKEYCLNHYGDTKCIFLFENERSLVFLSIDSCIEVLNIIDKKTHTFQHSEEI